MLICPFSNTALKELSKKELANINQKVADGLFFFYKGAKVLSKLKRAFVSANKSYIYPVFDDILYIKKETAIVMKNRVANPLLRINEDEADLFYYTYGLKKTKISALRSPKPLEVKSKPLSLEQIAELGSLLPKSGNCFMSMVTHDVDAVHNLVFGTEFNHYIHMDFSLDRLRSVVGQLKKDTLYVLGDMEHFPVADDTVDSLFLFDFINAYSKETQKQGYAQLKRALRPQGVSVVLYDKNKPVHAKSQHKTDLLAQKTRGVVTPWKKTKLPQFYFFPVTVDDSEEQDFIPKTSLLRQFS